MRQYQQETYVTEAKDRNEVKYKNKMEYQNESELSLMKRWDRLKDKIIWRRVFQLIVWHSVAFYGFVTFPYSSHKLTVLWIFIQHIFVMFGITAGVHRYWSHRTFKAKVPLRLIMAAGYYGAGMFKIYDWVRMHRIHHKYTDTDADPHNADNGFFFSHIGWLMLKKDPKFYAAIKEIDMSDIDADQIATFADKYPLLMSVLMSLILPSLVPIVLWNEDWYYAFMSQTFMRYVTVLNATLFINSAAHLYGSRPFNKHINPRTNYFVQFVAIGEGFHNYHHTFPWDYRTGESIAFNLNLTKWIIDQFAKIGWAYDLKTASDDLIKKTCKNRGDGTYKKWWEEVPEPQ